MAKPKHKQQESNFAPQVQNNNPAQSTQPQRLYQPEGASVGGMSDEPTAGATPQWDPRVND